MLIISSCGNETKSEAKSDADIALMIPNIEKPEGWFDGNFDNQKEKLKQILERNKYTDELFEELEDGNDIVLNLYSKYDISKYAGVSPTINLMLRKNIDKFNLEDLFNQGSLMTEVMTEMGLEEYTLLKNEYTNLPNGTKAVKQKSTYKIPNRIEKITSTIYFYFISEKSYVQLSLSCVDNEDCDEVFNKVLENL